jgi:hypothetical protein
MFEYGKCSLLLLLLLFVFTFVLVLPLVLVLLIVVGNDGCFLGCLLLRLPLEDEE